MEWEPKIERRISNLIFKELELLDVQDLVDIYRRVHQKSEELIPLAGYKDDMEFFKRINRENFERQKEKYKEIMLWINRYVRGLGFDEDIFTNVDDFEECCEDYDYYFSLKSKKQYKIDEEERKKRKGISVEERRKRCATSILKWELWNRKVLAKETGTVEDLQALCTCYEKIFLSISYGGHTYGMKAAREELAKKIGTTESYMELWIASAKYSFYENVHSLRAMIDKKLDEELRTAEKIRNMGVLYERLGDAYEQNACWYEAQEYYGESLRIRKRLTGETVTLEDRQEMGVLYEKLGDTCGYTDDLSKMREYYEEGVRIFEKLSEESETKESRRERSNLYGKLGDVYRRKKDIDKARKCAEACLCIRKELLSETGTVNDRRNLGIACEKLGDVFHTEGDLVRAWENYETALQISRELAKETNSEESRQELADLYWRLGCASGAEGNFTRSCEYYRADIQIKEELTRKKTRIDSKEQLHEGYGSKEWKEFYGFCEDCGNICKKEGNLDGACLYYEEILNVKKRYPKCPYYRYEDELLWKLGCFYEKRKKLSKALECFEARLEKLRMEVEEKKSKEGERSDGDGLELSANYEKLGDIFYEKGDTDKAWEHYRAGLQIREELEDRKKRNQKLRVFHEKLGDICKNAGEPEKAREYYEAALQNGKQLEDAETLEARQEAANLYEKLGDVCKDTEDIGKAMEYYEESFRIRKQLVEESNTKESRRQACISCYKLGDICHVKGDLDKAIEYYVSISSKMLGMGGSMGSREDYMQELKCRRIYEEKGDLKNAEWYANRAYRSAKYWKETMEERTGTMC